MTDPLAEAVRKLAQRDREAAERRAAVTRARQAEVRRREAIEAEDEFRFYDRLMRETPHR